MAYHEKDWLCRLRCRERHQVLHGNQESKRRKIISMEKKKFKLGLLPKLLIAIVLGIIVLAVAAATAIF